MNMQYSTRRLWSQLTTRRKAIQRRRREHTLRPFLEALEDRRLLAAIFTVLNTNDSGAGSLRQAIADSNNTVGEDLISFNIPGTGVHTIAPQTKLPEITDAVTIDGYTQPGAAVNTLAYGTNATLRVELRGDSITAGLSTVPSLVISGDASIVRGLVLNRGRAQAIDISGNNNRIEGVFIGSDSTGSVPLESGGIRVTGNGNTIGGTAVASRNLISTGSLGLGIQFDGGDTGDRLPTGNVVQGNLIGANAAGTTKLGGNTGILIGAGGSNTIGGTATGAGNVIAYQDQAGIFVNSDLNSITGNSIHSNGGAGVYIGDGISNSIVSNKIYSNGGLGIDLANSGVNANDLGDGDLGANKGQNYPLLSSAVSTPTSTTVTGTLNSKAYTYFKLQFFANTEQDPSLFGEGETLIGEMLVSTDASGNKSFSVRLPSALGKFISATATVLANDFVTLTDTSEFSPTLFVPLSVNEAPVAKAGTDLEAGEGATVQFDATGSSDPNGDTLAYAWDFGDGTTGNGPAPTHVYADNGSYTVTLTVDDGRGLNHSDALIVIVANIAPSATLSQNGPVNEGSAVTVFFSSQFDPSSADTTAGYVYSYDFNNDGDFVDLGDLENVHESSASFTFAAPGNFPVRGRITDKDGGWSEYTTGVTVNNLVDLSGRVFTDRNNNGLPDSEDAGLSGVAVQLFNEADLTTPMATRITGNDGVYTFDVKLGPGSYRIVEIQPPGWLDGMETAGGLGGSVDNTQDSNIIGAITVAAGDPDVDGYNFANIPPGRIQGLVWEDVNNDGEVDFGESAIEGTAIRLTGIDDWGTAVDQAMNTDAHGLYEFTALRPGNYTLTETQPLGYADGLDVVGTVNGVLTGSNAVDDVVSQINFLNQPGADAVNYNFAERPESGSNVESGQTAAIGFWQNKNGQSLIRSLNGGAESQQLGNWLATTFSNMYAGLAGMSNKQVADHYVSLFKRNHQTAPDGPPKLDAQTLAVALAVYVTSDNLAGTTATSYGFTVTQNGVGYKTFNVGNNGAAFGKANGAEMTLLDLLLATNAKTQSGLLYDQDGDGKIDDVEANLRAMANEVFSNINQAGEI